MLFDRALITATHHRIEALKSEFDKTEQETALINKRETLLAVPKTQFSELRVIQDDLKPLYELWVVASGFNTTMPQWIEEKFERIDAGVVETQIAEWINELKRLQKTNLCIEHPKQKELRDFMYKSLMHF